MDRGEESFIRWSSFNDRDDDYDDDGAYFELELRPHNININLNIDEQMELVDVPFPGFQALTAKSYEHQNQQQLHVEINSRWGPWGLVHTRKESSVMNGRRSWTVKVRAINMISISAASVERWFANFTMTFRLRSWKEKMMKMKIMSSRNTAPPHNSIIITNSSRSAPPLPPNLGHHSSFLHAAIAHCNNSCFPPLTLNN